MSCPDKKAARVYLGPDDYAAIEGAAKRAGLSVSGYMKTVCLGGEVKSFEYEAFKLELLKLRADLGRLGGLFKLALADPDKIFEGRGFEAQSLKTDFRNLLQEIESRQAELKRVASKI